MKSHQLSKMFRYIYSACAIISVSLFLFGCSGNDGTSVGTITGQVTDNFGNKVAGATITPAPLPDGVKAVIVDDGGNYTITLPNGSYQFATAQTGYAPLSTAVAVVSGQTSTVNLKLTANAPAALNVASKAFTGGTATLAANLATFDPALSGKPVTFTWKDAAGNTIGSTASVNVTQPSSAAFKATVAELVKPLSAIEPPEVVIDADGEKNTFKSIRVFETLDRVMVVGIPQKAFEDAAATPFTVSATVNGQTFTAKPTVSVPTNTLPFVPNPGLRNVPVGQPVMLQGRATATWNWTITPPAGSAVTALVDPTTRFPHFIPDLVGAYTLTETVSGKTLTIYAGKWVGILVPDANNNPLGALDTACSSNTCHSGSVAFSTAINDKFTEWKKSGHSEIMVQGMSDPAGHYSLTSCGKCHSVGFAQFSSAIKAGGFKEVIDATKFTFKQGTASFVGFDQVLRLSEVQCEACHGPNNSAAHDAAAPAGAIAAQNDAVTARINYSADVCAVCHGEPPRHGRFQEWRESGHGNYETARAEGVAGVAAATPTGTGPNTNCAGCHSSQGFLLFIQQLQGGNPLRTLNPVNATALAYLRTDNVQPQTCVTCHTPHNPGKQSGIVGNIIILRGDYQAGGAFDGSTPLLPGGFQANGVGRGAICITCHNSRNGGVGTAPNGTATLHEDGDVNFGLITSYSSPHEACQGDVLMGRNAYFFSSFSTARGREDLNLPGFSKVPQIGQRSRHSFLADACVTCHLQKAAADPTLGYPANIAGAGTNHSFGIITDATKTANEQINALCAQCHGSFEGTGVQKSFDAAYNRLLIAVQNAILRVKFGSAAAIPAGTTLTFIPGRTPQVSLNGAVPVNLATFLASAPGTANTGAIPTTGFQRDLGKANWNTVLVAPRYDATFNGTSYDNGTPIVNASGAPAEVAGDQSKAVHNPSFVFNVINVTIARMNAL